MKTKKVLILILLIILAISSTACVDKDSVEYIYNIRRFVGEYENVDPGIWIESRNIDNPDETSYYFECVNKAITTTGFTSVSNPNDIKFVEKQIDTEEVEFFNAYIKMLSKTIEVKKKEVKFVESNNTKKIIKSFFEEQVMPMDKIYGHLRTLVLDENIDSDLNFAIGLGYHEQTTKAILLIVKRYTNQNGEKKFLKITINYLSKE